MKKLIVTMALTGALLAPNFVAPTPASANPIVVRAGQAIGQVGQRFRRPPGSWPTKTELRPGVGTHQQGQSVSWSGYRTLPKVSPMLRRMPALSRPHGAPARLFHGPLIRMVRRYRAFLAAHRPDDWYKGSRSARILASSTLANR